MLQRPWKWEGWPWSECLICLIWSVLCLKSQPGWGMSFACFEERHSTSQHQFVQGTCTFVTILWARACALWSWNSESTLVGCFMPHNLKPSFDLRNFALFSWFEQVWPSILSLKVCRRGQRWQSIRVWQYVTIRMHHFGEWSMSQTKVEHVTDQRGSKRIKERHWSCRTWEARSSFASFAMRPDRDSPDRALTLVRLRMTLKEGHEDYWHYWDHGDYWESWDYWTYYSEGGELRLYIYIQYIYIYIEIEGRVLRPCWRFALLLRPIGAN
jgi:hypothetical protein